MVSFTQAVKSGIYNVFNIKGRASRSEFWWFSLFLGIVGFSLGFISGLFDVDILYKDIVYELLHIALWIACMSITIRRLHDVNQSAWWVIVCLICDVFFSIVYYIAHYIVGFDNIDPYNSDVWFWIGISFYFWVIWTIVLLVFCAKKGTQGDNRFGADPLDLSAQESKINEAHITK